MIIIPTGYQHDYYMSMSYSDVCPNLDGYMRVELWITHTLVHAIYTVSKCKYGCNKNKNAMGFWKVGEIYNI